MVFGVIDLTFTIAEDIKTLLTDDWDNTKIFINITNGTFETGDLTGWTVTSSPSASGVQKHGGSWSCLFDSAADSIKNTSLFIRVSELSASEFWYYFPTGETGSLSWIVTYDDGTNENDTITAGNFDVWTKVDFLSTLDTQKIITAFEIIGATTTGYVDDIVFTYSSNTPTIRLIDDDPPTAYDEGGEIIIGREQFLRIDQYNGIRSETFIVDITLSYDDVAASKPTILKRIMKEIDRVFDAESLAHTSYYYRPRYDWPGSYRAGVTRFQIEVLNALVTRPGLT